VTNWLGLIIGNSRLHWAWFEDKTLQETWDTPHLLEKIDSAKSLNQYLPPQYQQIVNTELITIYLASVVPFQTALWENYPHKKHQVALKDVPIQNTYTTLGIDRALAIYGAGETYHYPCLVIDAGTALTFTGIDDNQVLIGGAILPGLRSQFRTLDRQTAALPEIILSSELPPLWALNTQDAIASGIIYTLVAGIYSYISNWLDLYPNSSIAITGGDSQFFFQYLQTLSPQIAKIIVVDRNLGFWGMRSIKSKL
jgi:type III pantothenate kinase